MFQFWFCFNGCRSWEDGSVSRMLAMQAKFMSTAPTAVIPARGRKRQEGHWSLSRKPSLISGLQVQQENLSQNNNNNVERIEL